MLRSCLRSGDISDRRDIYTIRTDSAVADTRSQWRLREHQLRRSEAFTVLRALSPEIFNFKGFEHGLMEFPLPHLEPNSLAYAIHKPPPVVEAKT